MRVYLLRTTGSDPAYEPLEAENNEAVRRLPRAEAEPRRPFDPAQDEGQFVHAVMCQGVSLQSMDHYAVKPGGGKVTLSGWNDDPEDHPAPWAVVWEFRTPKPSQRHGGRVDTEQFCTVYGNDDYYPHDTTSGGPVVHRPWSEFRVPPPGLTLHGVWTDDDLNDRHMRALREGNARFGWRPDGDD
jgi:hypothetical protein